MEAQHAQDSANKGILEGVRILDWTNTVAGPVATMLLGHLGAEVIHIEDRVKGDPIRGLTHNTVGVPLQMSKDFHMSFEYYNNSKLGITLDLTKPKGREVIYALARNSDVFVTNWHLKSAEKLGLDYASLAKLNDKIIYAHASAFGEQGPYKDAPAYDLTAQAMGGIMMSSGTPKMPPILLAPCVADVISATFLAYGILAAIIARDRLGIGQEVYTSQLAGLLMLQAYPINVTLQTGRPVPREDRKRKKNPIYNYYKCKGGDWIALGSLQGERFWSIFCKAIGQPALEKDPRFDTMAKRSDRSEELVTLLDKVFIRKTREEWAAVMQKNDLIYAPVNKITDLVDHPQVLANKYIEEFYHEVVKRPVRFLGHPVRFGKTPARIKRAPQFGEHTGDVLQRVGGYSWEEIARLAEEEVI